MKFAKMEDQTLLNIEGSSVPKNNGDRVAPPQVEESGREKTGKSKLWSWLNGSLKIKMTDGRVLVGNFFCTDRDSNVILGSSGEYLKEEDVGVEQPRVLGLVMVPGRHIVSIHYLSDTNKYSFD